MALMGILSKYVKILLHTGRGHLHQECICIKIQHKMEVVSEIRENGYLCRLTGTAPNVITVLSTIIRVCNNQHTDSWRCVNQWSQPKKQKLLKLVCFGLYWLVLFVTGH